MACYSPLKGYKSKAINPSGKRSIVFNPKQGYIDLPIEVPCGQCIGCRLEHSRQWAIRCYHEASLYDENSFITLTYDEENLPENGSLNKKHFQDFMKRLRFHYKNKKIRYFQCGEYGEKNSRPHYHACLFNLDFADKEIYSERATIKLYTSPTLEKIWGKGFTTIGDVTFQSAAYVARYIMKKVTGHKAKNHYTSLNQETGELTEILPEYTTMSRRPGIAKFWYDQFSTDIYPSDKCVVQGRVMRPPKYYDTLLEKTHSDLYKKLKTRRLKKSLANKKDNTPERLRTRETVTNAKINHLKRTI